MQEQLAGLGLKVLTAKADGKLNLWLDLGGQRADGYHDLKSLMQSVDLADSLFFVFGQVKDHYHPAQLGAEEMTFLQLADQQFPEAVGGRQDFQVEHPVQPELTVMLSLAWAPHLVQEAAQARQIDPGDLSVYRALAYYLQVRDELLEISGLAPASKRRRLVGIGLYKRIPSGAGLGGASTDAAAVLRLLAELDGLNLAARQSLVEAAAVVGADCPFSLLGGLAEASGVGEVLRSAVPPEEKLPFLILKPAESISTASAFAAYGKARAQGWRPQLSQAEAFGARLRQGPKAWSDLTGLGMNSFAQLERPDRSALEEMFGILEDLDALYIQMSGSGNACFGLFASEQAARAASHAPQVKAFRAAGGWARVAVSSQPTEFLR